MRSASALSPHDPAGAETAAEQTTRVARLNITDTEADEKRTFIRLGGRSIDDVKRER